MSDLEWPGIDRSEDDDLPENLRNWRVIGDDDAYTVDTVEVDGEFRALPAETPSARPSRMAAAPALDDSGLDAFDDDPVPSIQPMFDDVLVASVDSNRLAVKPGTSAALKIALINNGRRSAHFRVRLEGWIHSDWVTMPRMPVKLDPGQRSEFTLTIAPPRAAASTAGRHEMLLVVQSPEYPERQTRLPLLLAIAPFDDLQLSDFQPRRLGVTWAQRTANARVTVSNHGNRSAKVRLLGQCTDAVCGFAFGIAPGSSAKESITLELEAGQTETVNVAVRPARLPLVGIKERTSAVRVVGSLVGKPQVPRAGMGQLRRRPLIGPPQMVIGVMLAMVAFLGMILLGAVGFGLTQLVATTRSARPVQAPIAPVVVVVPVNEPVPATPFNLAPAESAAPVPANPGDAIAAPAQRDRNVPLVGAEQVTVPGGGAPTASGGPVAGNRSDMTYSQLFREIGGKYDLDWRMLAAQAYVESRFDTVAIGRDGDLGLMQVLPRTWAEWSANVDVSDPFDAYSNVLVAAAYLDYVRGLLAQRGLSDVRWMLVAYNWGPDKLLNHLDANRGWDDLDPTLRQYAVDVLGIAETIPLE